MAIIQVGQDLVDEETGEYAGPANTYLPDELSTEDDLIAYMHRLSDAESELRAKQLQLEAVIENCRKMVKRHEDRIAWLKRKHEANARYIAYSMLPRKKDGTFATKTFTCPWGNVAFRESKPTIAIENETRALEWCLENMPSAIKVKESILITPLKERFLGKDNSLSGQLPPGFEYVEGAQTATFKTLASEDREN